MRRYTATLAVAGLIAAVAAGVALAAAPATFKSFSGKGGSYTIQNGHWAVIGTGHFRFRTGGRRLQRNGTFVYIEGLFGTYLKCDGSKLFVRANNIAVPVTTGKFSFRFNSSGAAVRIWGNFTGNGTVAKLNYLVNFSGSDTNPSTVHSGCASWVHGTATTT